LKSKLHTIPLRGARIVALLLALTAQATFLAPLGADQTDPGLESLFDTLLQASNNTEAQRVEGEIWQRWLNAPDANSAALMSQISAAMSTGQHALALELCNQLVDASPDYAEAWNKRATIQYLLGNHGRSVADIKETLLLEPRHFGALSGLGLIFMASGNYEAALDVFVKVQEISPASDNAKGSIARARSLLGKDI